MIEESDTGEQSSDELKEQVKSLEEKLAKQQKLTDQIAKDCRKKSMTAATILAVIFGAFGICGIGHFYAGKKLIGTLILIGGLFIVLLIVAAWNNLTSSYTVLPDPDRAINVSILIVSFYLILYGFQIFHARHYCQKYNKLIEKEE